MLAGGRVVVKVPFLALAAPYMNPQPFQALWELISHNSDITNGVHKPTNKGFIPGFHICSRPWIPPPPTPPCGGGGGVVLVGRFGFV